MASGDPIGTYGITLLLAPEVANSIDDVKPNNDRIPRDWGRSVICPIYKNKGVFLKCGNYREISMLNHAVKIYESVQERRLRNIVEERLVHIVEERLVHWQHGIRRGKGTTDMTCVLIQLMEKPWKYAMTAMLIMRLKL